VTVYGGVPGGVDALLATLAPHWHWDPPVLRVPSHWAFRAELCGRGLRLLPSYFAETAMIVHDQAEPTVLVYPIPAAAADAPGAGPGADGDGLGALLGRTRAAVLRALRSPAGTTALAERTGISPASASEHAAVLRRTGLVTTARVGGGIVHTLTPLGEALAGPR
jgi:DNA-binding transcriptional ArsR family regulator